MSLRPDGYIIIAGRRVVGQYQDKKDEETEFKRVRESHNCCLVLTPDHFLKEGHDIQYPWSDNYLNKEYCCTCEKSRLEMS